MRIEQDIINILPLSIRHNMKNLSFEGLEEIRFRIGMPIELIYDVGNRWMNDLGPMNRWALEETLNYITGYSYYAMEEELKNGYITMNGGHRVGLTGRASYSRNTLEKQTLKGLMDIGGLNIMKRRIVRKRCFLLCVRKKESITRYYLHRPALEKQRT